jgi:glycosyltransferase involved in cell wall biosynthesis
LIQAGARALVAAERGALVDDLKSFGGEWLPFATTTFNPVKLRRNAEAIATFVAGQRVDIVHAKGAGAAWSALAAAGRNSARTVTDLPDLPRQRMRLAALTFGALGRADRIVARSLFNARPMMERYRIAPQRIAVVPPAIDTALFDPATVHPEHVSVLRKSWGIPSGVRIVLAPGRVARWNGQITLVAAARALSDRGIRGFTFVLAGDDRRDRRYVSSIMAAARRQNVDMLFRVVGHVADMPMAYAASDFVVAPCLKPPLYGRVVAEAQAMAKPVIAAAVGPLPENLLTPPRMADALRTGWVVPPNDPAELATALAVALALDIPSYRAMAARAREFAEFMFAPRRVAEATLDVYRALLEPDA